MILRKCRSENCSRWASDRKKWSDCEELSEKLERNLKKLYTKETYRTFFLYRSEGAKEMKKFLAVAAAALFAAAVFAGCSSGKAELALVTDGGTVDDGSVNQGA